jgi:XTP/dITP diphosphohydrolase
MALAFPDGRLYRARGECAGIIALAPQGNQGFGYDPVFLVPAYGRTMAQLAPKVKNMISHRARALEALKELLISLRAELTTSG